MSAPGSGSGSGPGAGPGQPSPSSDVRLLLSLVESLSQRLPSTSGSSLALLEGDVFFSKTAKALVELCPWRLWDVVGSLSQLLSGEGGGGGSGSMSKFHSSKDTDTDVESDPTAINNLHSQLFVLRLIANCLAYYWKLYRETRGKQPASTLDISIDDDEDDVPDQSQQNPSHLTNPPALDESLANYLLSHLSTIFLTYLSEITLESISHPDFLRSLGFVDDRDVSPTPYTRIASFFTHSKSSSYLPNPSLFHTPAYPDIYLELQKEAGKIIFYLSASNWSLVLSKIRARLYTCTSSVSMEAASDSGLVAPGSSAGIIAFDVAELRFMEFLNLDLQRLPSLLIELNQCFKFLPKRVQYLTAIGIRKSIWNWIETHPHEFIDVQFNQRRVDGSPEVFFLTLNSLNDVTSRRRNLFWPTQMMLLALNPDLFVSTLMAVLGTPVHHATNPYKRTITKMSPDLSKRAENWFEAVRKAMRSKGSMAEVSLFCQVDLLKLIAVLAKPGAGPISDYYRAIIAPVDFDMRDKLFSKLESRPSGSMGVIQLPESGMTLDYRVPTEALTAIFKLNSFHSLRPLISGFFSSAAPGVYRVILIRSCYELASEDEIGGVNSSLAIPLRTLFLAQENVLKNAQAMLGMELDLKVGKSGLFAGKNAKKEKAIKMQAINDLTAEHFDLVYGTIKLWAKSPSLVIAQDNSILPLDDLCTVLYSLVNYTSHDDPYIRSKAGETLRAVFATEFVSVWDGSSANWRFPSGKPTEISMQFYWNTSSSVFGKLSALILTIPSEPLRLDAVVAEHPILKEMLNLLRDLLKSRTEFLKKNASLASIGSSSQERAQATIELEKLLLVLLCHPSTEIVSTAITCIGYLVEEMDATSILVTDEPGPSSRAPTPHQLGVLTSDEQPISMMQNLEVYRELRTLIGGVGLIASSRAMQRRVRNVIIKMEAPSLGALAAWEEIYGRWRDLFRPILGEAGVSDVGGVAIGDSNASLQDRGERQNYTAFLCAMGGVCHAASVEINRQTAQTDYMQGIPITKEAEFMDQPNKLNSDIQIAFSTAKKNVEDFIADLQTLMVCDNDVVREFVKNFLGTELNSGLFGILFSSCEANVTKFLGPDEINNRERNIFFVVQRKRPNEFHSKALAGGVNFGSLIFSFVQYLNGVQRNQSQSSFLLIRTKVCQLVEIVVAKKDIVGLRSEIRFKNLMLDFVLGWNAEISLRSMEDVNGRDESEGRRPANAELKMIRDLDLASMRALVAILDGLPLQVTPEAMVVFKTNDGSDDKFEGQNEFKEHLFHSYLDFFLKVLDKCRYVEALESKNLEAHPGNMVADTMSNYLTIRALSNLLAANIDIGLKYSLSMGYHDDSKTRASFMLVLTNLLESGGKQQFEGLGEEVEVTQNRYKRLVDMVVSPDELYVALAMGGISDVEDVAGILLSVFETRGEFSRLMTAAIQVEVDRTDYAPNLFRQNSMATRLLTVYSKKYGNEYLVNAIKPVLDELLVIRANLSFEIDPNKIAENELLDSNRKNVATLVNHLLDNLLGSDKFPAELRVVCAKLADIVGQRFPEHKTTAVGAFMFLRFINPLIVAPWTLNIVAPIQDRRLMRGLVLATKVIQNLANNLLFNSKEPFMEGLNDLLQENHKRVIDFLKHISEVDNATIAMVEERMAARQSNNISEFDLMRLHRVLQVNLDKVEISLTGSQTNLVLSKREIAKRKTKFAALAVLLTQLGPAPDKNKIQAKFHNVDVHSKNPTLFSDPSYTDFVKRVQSRSGYELALDKMKERGFFYESGVSREGNRVLYFIARRFKQHTINMDMFLYFVLTALAEFTATRFELVVDVTQFSTENEWDVSLIRRMMELVPEYIQSNLAALYIYRCNTGFSRYIKSVIRAVEIPICERVFFLSDEKEMSYFISPDEIRIPRSIVDSEKGIISKGDVQLISGLRESSPVTLRLSADFIHITHLKRQQVFGFEAMVTDVVKFADIRDVVASENLNEFSIKYIEKVGGVYGTGSIGDTTISTMTLSSTIKSRRGTLIADERTLRPNDVPGTLLNMAILNMGSRDPNLRLASYNLLYALSYSFDFKVRHQLLSTKGLCIPANDMQYVKAMSQKLAATEQHLTLEFLIEFVIGFNKSTVDQKIFCLEYLAPWLQNLNAFACAEHDVNGEVVHMKVKSLMKLLIEATVKEVELFHLIQTNLWLVIGKVDGMLPIVMEAFIQISINNGLASNYTQILTNTLRSIATANGEAVAKYIISRLLELAGSENMATLIAKGTWTEVAVLIRFLLMLSFDDVIDVEKYLPDIMHIITLTAGYGQPLIRGSKASFKPWKQQCGFEKHAYCLEVLSDAKFRTKFGIANSGEDSEAWFAGKNDLTVFFPVEASANEILEGISPQDLKDIATELVKVVNTGCGRAELAKTWKERWFELIVNTTFNFSYVQSRTFITLGALSRDNSSVDMLFRCTSSLMGYLALYEETELTALNVSITSCITDIIHGLPKTPETLHLLKSYFWLAMGLIQLSDVHIFSAGATLLKTIIQILDENGEFRALGFAETLKQSRSVADFSFAFTANVLKGLGQEKSRELTVSLLKLALEVSGRNPPDGVPETGHEYVADHCAGFIIPLLAVTPTSEIKELFKLGGVDEELLNFEWAVPKASKALANGEYVGLAGATLEADEHKFRDILECLTPLTDENRSILMLTLIVSVLEISELEAEAVFIYGFLAEATLQAPEIVFILYESLLPRMSEIVTGPNSPNLITSVHSIFQTMMARKAGNTTDQVNALNGVMSNINNVMGGFGVSANIAPGSIIRVPHHHQHQLQSQISHHYNSITSSLTDEIDDALNDFSLGREDGLRLSPMDGKGGAMVGPAPLPLCMNQQLLGYLQELGFTGVASSNSFDGAGIVEQKQICSIVVQLIRVVLVQLQQSSPPSP
ncbi:hypothetical protein BCR33DRAFT_845142 [Rhizoclosmatium globosum]|uniref:Ras-GAP domain-containing protein n=1 Tax=Rhizoclosmatium globosum TaxID=329046 RepID=A0A1Y2D0P6_9FUNG|nr:hypothetical protein BCR33DRAFT_845142 [Rhizoclosmatium globosum]|eukprot:ORY52851.1 hypothetical protein BCR33DRAFT_845142 [Rhizoclosmatium globosum]